MSEWKELALWMFGDVRTREGFWYSHQLHEIDGLTEDQLFWVPQATGLCILWHVGHIAHRERLHIGRFLQGLTGTIIPPPYEIFGAEWCSTAELRQSIDSVSEVLAWVQDVRKSSRDFIASLTAEDFQVVLPTSELDLSVGYWLFITAAHTALHIGRIQLLRALIEGRHERPC